MSKKEYVIMRAVVTPKIERLNLRQYCDYISREFSPLLAAKVRAAKARKIMAANTSFKFRLNQLVSMDARLGQVWPVSYSQLSTATCATMPFSFLCEISSPL